ncbi:hypothetical protein VII00023_17814 [Vibrio ichthyoenteri ATCC 700023]|uniref:Metallo-beta-lactamase domain-containing protein n=1 Tax=Vibrio ichthyoenteri ATCC 700023 TaxID=870968 RepID=F9RY74_9VIBR|nr:hypothetical protein VII00023_17814 [Vibrio ichthyoenteri ATCC 700023]
MALIVILTSSNLLLHQSNTLFQAGSNIIINAEVDSLFKPIKHGFQGIASVRSINGERLSYLSRPKVYLITPKNLQLGDRITAQVRIKPVVGVLNEVGFDREKYAVSQSVTGAASINTKHSYFIQSTASLRQFLFNRMFQASKSFSSQGLLLALSFGERGYIPSSQWHALQQSGLSHLIAISGLHVGIAFSVGWLIGFALLRAGGKKVWLPLIFGGAAALGYAWLAGFAIPTQRALMMVGVLMLLQLTRIHTSYRFTWLLVVCVLLLGDPFASYAASFWLSISAVAIIFLFLSCRLQIRSGLLKAIFMQLCLVVVMALLVAWLYLGLSLHAFLYNLVFVPWFSFVVIPLLLLSVVLSVVVIAGAPLLTQWLINLVDWSLIPMDLALSFSDSLWFELSNQQVLWLIAALMLCSLGFIVSRQAWCILLLSVIFTLSTRTQNPEWRMDLLDVGHGLAIVIEKNQHALLYDTGAAWQRVNRATSLVSSSQTRDTLFSQGSYAQQLLIPLLTARGTTLDGVLISHFDNDHAGGLAAIVDRWPDVRIWASQSAVASQHKIEACIAGNSWRWQGIDIDVLWPPQLASRAYNPHSCVVRLYDSEHDHSILLTGDIEAVAEWMLLRQSPSLASDVIIVPHHGSKTSSSSAFIAKVSPQLALSSSAFQGRWLLPSPAVKARYLDAEANWFDTGSSGQISLYYRGKNRRLVALRSSKGLAWYRQMLRKRVE